MLRTHLLKAILMAAIGGLISTGCEPWVDERVDYVTLGNVLGRMTDSIEDGDLETLSDYILKGEMLTVSGPSMGDLYSGWDQVKKWLEELIDSLSDPEFILKERIILPGLKKRTVYFLQIMTVSGSYMNKPVIDREVRISGVLERHGGRWSVVFAHISYPVEERKQ